MFCSPLYVPTFNYFKTSLKVCLLHKILKIYITKLVFAQRLPVVYIFLLKYRVTKGP